MAGIRWPWARKSGATSAFGVLRELLNANKSATGYSISGSEALRVSTVFACVRVLADGVAQVPLKVYRQSPDGKQRVPARNLPLYDVLHRRPNKFQTSFEYRETVMMHAALCGQHMSYKVRGLGDVVRELIPLEPGRVTIKQAEDYTLAYALRGKAGDTREVPADDIWHVRGPSWNGYEGMDCVKLAREALGLSLATEEHHGRLHSNQAKPGGILSVDGKLSTDQYTQLRDWITNNFEGKDNAYRTAIMDNGAKWIPAVMNGVDAQHLETRAYQVQEVCRFFKVMPIMVGYTDKAATYASAEQMFLAHVVHTLAPWYERLEQSMDVNLLTEQERADGHYAKFTEEGLLRGSLKDTKDYLLGLVNGGLMTPNEGRAKLDLNPDADPASDQLRIPANIVGETPAPDTEPTPQPAA